ncbi:hypothetical protein SEA_MOLLYMUR_80 [Gordonia phage Mollymur]|uniref:Uncharacterized protein n=1 Tax=Gordonia phage Mollymur TaxID=2590895 RepID=A0A4Y6EBU6_9CAUD|nr:hypothetical protein PQB84_gp046 [Gordonia phage Mollymur]QDF15440.1 hypothetical protein SEA_MOLLYMUR_80 [Gordonia phage Mollymur]
MNDYVLGVITPFAAISAVVALYFVGGFLIAAWQDWWTSPMKLDKGDAQDRIEAAAVTAAAVFAARRLWIFKLPTSRVTVIFRSTVPGPARNTFWTEVENRYRTAKYALLDQFEGR